LLHFVKPRLAAIIRPIRRIATIGFRVQPASRPLWTWPQYR
jgi:hypothetical protein